MANEVEKFLNEVNGNDNLTNQNSNPFKDLNLNAPEGEEGEDDPNKGKEKEGDEGGEGEGEGEPNLPKNYHDDPKLQRYISKMIQKGLKGMTPQQQTIVKEKAADAKTGDEFISVFEQILGNDTPEKVSAINNLKQWMTTVNEQATSGQRLMEEQQRAEAAAEEELSEGLESIEDTYGVDLTSTDPKARKLRGEFLDFVEKIAPKDRNGRVIAYPDFENAFDLFKNRTPAKPQPTNRSKELASRSMGRSTEAKIPENTGNSWKDVDRYFSKLEDRN